jgi:hypothetical protein
MKNKTIKSKINQLKIEYNLQYIPNLKKLEQILTVKKQELQLKDKKWSNC